MKRTILILATALSLGAAPVFASKAKPCDVQLDHLEAAIKTSSAPISTIHKATTLHQVAADSCNTEGGHPYGVATVNHALALLGTHG